MRILHDYRYANYELSAVCKRLMNVALFCPIAYHSSHVSIH